MSEYDSENADLEVDTVDTDPASPAGAMTPPAVEVKPPAAGPVSAPQDKPAHGYDFSSLGNDVRPLADAFGTAMQQAEVPPHAVDAALSFFHETQAGDQSVPEADHGYRVSEDYGLTDKDQPNLIRFLNAQAKAGASQAEVDHMLRWYTDLMQKHGHGAQVKAAQGATETARVVEEADKRDRESAQAAMRKEWGAMYPQNIRLLNKYLDGLSASEREAIESETLANGKLSLNDPDRLSMLLERAQGGSETRKEIESMMRNPRSAYFKGPDSERLQSRYRALVSQGSQHTERTPTGIDAEIAKIERDMKTNINVYFKDEAKQARYRQLLEMRDGK